MQLGISIAIFILSAIILMAFFCAVSYYFSHKLRKALVSQNQVYSLVEGIEGEREDINEGEYQDFVQKRIEDRMNKDLGKNKEFLDMKEMFSTAEPLKYSGERIYEMNNLKLKLGIDDFNYTMGSAARSLFSAKTFKQSQRYLGYYKLNVGKSSLNTPRFGNPNQNNNSKVNKPNFTCTNYKFINKIVSYKHNGVEIISCKVQQIRQNAENQQIQQIKKVISQTEFGNDELGAEDAIELYGFEMGTYSAYKFSITVEIINIKLGEIYKISHLKKSTQKQQINLQQYQKIKQKMIQKQTNQQK